LKFEKAKSPVWEYFRFPAENGQYLEKIKRREEKSTATFAKRS